MSDQNDDNGKPKLSRRQEREETKKLTSAQKRIEWARSLSNQSIVALLQDALVRCRAQQPNIHEVVLTEQVVHELKNRLLRYDKVMGPLNDGDDDA